MLSHISTLIQVQRTTDLPAHQREKLMRDLAENLPLFVWGSDELGKKTYCSRRYLDFTGASGLEQMDRSWTDFIHPADRAATAAAWKHSITSGAPYEARYRLRRADGAYRYVRAQALPVCDSEGHVTGWLGMSRDVTVQRIVEQEKETEAKLAAVKQLASSIAHEINNPLESVTNALFLASLNENIDETTRGYLKMADSELRRLAHLTSSSLRFHKQTGRPVRRQMGQLIDEVLSTYKARLEQSGITVERRYYGDAELFCYADDLSQAITNLVRNAIDAMKSGGTLFVGARMMRGAARRHPRRVRVIVADTGGGITPQVGSHLFEPFFTTKGSTHAGLALWVTNEIVRKHGGTISFRSSTQGALRGTVFSLTLPTNGLDRDCI